MATFIQEGVYLDHTPVGALAQGDVVAIEDDFFGVATAAIGAGVKGALAVQGVFEFDSDGVIAAGALVFWDSETEKVSATPAPDCYIGRAVAAAAGNLCRVALNASNIGEYIPIAPGASPDATQEIFDALTATDPTCDAADPTITAVAPVEMNATDPTVTGPTTEGIVGTSYADEAAAIKAAIAQNDTNVDAIKAALDNLIDDVTAVRTQLVAAIADLATLRDSDKAIIDDVQAIETSLEAGIDDLGTLRTAVNAGKVDLAAVVTQLEAAQVLK